MIKNVVVYKCLQMSDWRDSSLEGQIQGPMCWESSLSSWASCSVIMKNSFYATHNANALAHNSLNCADLLIESNHVSPNNIN